MEVLRAKVNWFENFDNDPMLQVLVDEIPRDLVYTPYKTGGNSTLYYGEQDGYVNYLLHDPDDETGYGGRIFDLRLEKGERIRIKGPWSSRPGVINTYINDGITISKDVVDVSMTDVPEAFDRGHTFRAGCVSLYLAGQAAKLAKHRGQDVIMEETERNGERSWYPRIKLIERPSIYGPLEIRLFVEHLKIMTSSLELVTALRKIEQDRTDFNPTEGKIFHIYCRTAKYLRKYYGRGWQDLVAGPDIHGDRMDPILEDVVNKVENYIGY